MARQRLIKPDFFQHPDLHRCETQLSPVDTGAGTSTARVDTGAVLVPALPCRVAYIGLWCQADRRGLFRWEPVRLKLNILPFDDVDFAAVLERLRRFGFIESYVVGGKRYGRIIAFAKHQTFNVHEKPDKQLPEPTDDSIEPATEPVDTGAGTGTAPVDTRSILPSTGTVSSTGTSTSTAAGAGSARGTDTTTTATADPFAEALELVRCETSAQRHAVREFFAALPAGQRPAKWGSWLACLLEGMGMPGGQAATLDDLVVGLTEFLSDESRDFKQRFVLAFIADAKRRREQSGTARAAGNGSPNVAAVVEYSPDVIRRRAEFFEWLCNERTWNQSTPAYRQNDLQWLKRQGYVPDETRFLAEWQVLKPMADGDLYRDRTRGQVVALFAEALSAALVPVPAEVAS